MMFKQRKSLASIVASFNRMIADLEDLQQSHSADHDDLTARIINLQTERDNLIAERRQAEVIATNVRALLNGQAA